MKMMIIGKTGVCSPSACASRVRIPAAWAFASILLFGLLTVAAVRPAAAAQANTSHFMVSVQVVHNCDYQIESQPQKPSVVHVIMSGCSGQPKISTHGFAASRKQQLTGRDATRYLLRETHRTSISGSRYIEIDF